MWRAGGGQDGRKRAKAACKGFVARITDLPIYSESEISSFILILPAPANPSVLYSNGHVALNGSSCCSRAHLAHVQAGSNMIIAPFSPHKSNTLAALYAELQTRNYEGQLGRHRGHAAPPHSMLLCTLQVAADERRGLDQAATDSHAVHPIGLLMGPRVSSLFSFLSHGCGAPRVSNIASCIRSLLRWVLLETDLWSCSP